MSETAVISRKTKKNPIIFDFTLILDLKNTVMNKTIG
jgi:hypothetical protein